MNRIAALGGLIATLGFFFVPVINLKPNRLASGTPFGLLELTGDGRYFVLFALALIPLVLAFRDDIESRGWLLSLSGSALFLLTLILPAQAGVMLLENPEPFLGDGAFIRSPRILPSGGLALGLLGAYVTLFAGGRDLARAGVQRWVRGVTAWAAPAVAALLLVGGQFDVYSILVEFYANGAALQQKFVEHLLFVFISLAVGFVVGVSLGLWASRDERVSPVILYAVGIIQTIPSLALFGVLLVPLARLGDRLFIDTLIFFGVSLAVAAVVAGTYYAFADREPARLRFVHLLATAVSAAVPLVLFVGIFVSFIFRVANIGFTSGNYATAANTVGVFFALTVVAWLGGRWLLKPETRARAFSAWASLGLFGGTVVSLVVLFVQASGSSRMFGRVDSFATLTIRDLGVSGIGVAPALIALTLYSLLPLVRNTYAGLNNVDNAIIDSGRGMGMTPTQRFFQIELPLAFPVIMAGVRNAGVALVGIGTVATVIGAGGLGDFVVQGIVNTSIDQILLGAIPAIALALVLDAALRGIEGLLTSPGIKQVQN